MTFHSPLHLDRQPNKRLRSKIQNLTLLINLLGLPISYATTDCQQVTEIPREECQTLVELYKHTHGENWQVDINWNKTNTPCSWYGVVCEHEHVRGLVLFGNNMTGSIPNLTALSQLQRLSLIDNPLTGSIPDLTGFSQLEELSLNNNHLSGSVSDLSVLSQSLTVFSLSGNDFVTGTNCNQITEIPKEECETLLALYHSTNGVYWTNHTRWNTMSRPCNWVGIRCQDGHVQEIDLSNNHLNGRIPDLSGISQLQKLDLSHNQLRGLIPNLGVFSQLEELDLSSNQLSGLIPDLSALSQLRSLSLFHNQLVGLIPDLSTLSQLRFLILSNNQLRGSIPDLSTLSHLQELNLSNNQLSGPIPTLSTLSQLSSIRLENNQLIGTIPNLNNLAQLRILSLSNNQLSGTIPNLGTLSQLQSLLLSNNQLNGVLPEISVLSQLHDLTLDHNQLIGTVDFNVLPQLRHVSLSKTNLTYTTTQCDQVVQIPKEECEALLNFYHMTNGDDWKFNINWNITITPCSWYGVSCAGGHVRILTLPENRLSGSLPDFSAFSQLQSLSLGNNHLIGWFPNLKTLPQLRYLSLFNNNLVYSEETQCLQVTEIPKEECEALLTLYHSTNGENWRIDTNWNITNTPCSWYGIKCQAGHVTEIDIGTSNPYIAGSNNLSGSIPDLSALTHLRLLALTNNQLSGSIPDLSALTQLQYLHLGNNQLTGFIPNLRALSQLKQLSLRDNQLCGHFPAWLSTLALSSLELSNNHLIFPTDPSLIDFLHEHLVDQKSQTPSDSCAPDPMLATLMITLTTLSAKFIWMIEKNEDHLGFQLWRGEAINGRCENDPNNYLRVKPIVSTLTSSDLSVSGTSFTYVDSEVQAGLTYCYTVEEMLQGGQSLFHLEKMATLKVE